MAATSRCISPPGQSMTLAIAGTGHGFADRVDDPRRRPGARRRHQRLARPQLFARHRRRRDGAGAERRRGRRRRDDDRQRRRPAGPSGDPRAPASELAPDSDLGERLVTQASGPLAPRRGRARRSDARRWPSARSGLRRRGLIAGGGAVSCAAARSARLSASHARQSACASTRIPSRKEHAAHA